MCVVAYFSALCDLQLHRGPICLDLRGGERRRARSLTGTSAGALIDALGYVNFYLLTTALALPGILLFWGMMRAGLVDAAIGSAGKIREKVTAELVARDVRWMTDAFIAGLGMP